MAFVFDPTGITEQLTLAVEGDQPLMRFGVALDMLRLSAGTLTVPEVAGPFVPASTLDFVRFLQAVHNALPLIADHFTCGPREAATRLGYLLRLTAALGKSAEEIRAYAEGSDFEEELDQVALAAADLAMSYRAGRITERREARARQHQVSECLAAEARDQRTRREGPTIH